MSDYYTKATAALDKALEQLTKPADPINSPSHYVLGGIEVIDAIEAWGLGFRLANVVKYVARAAHKGKQLEDLKKARWYLDREISKLEGTK
jgi:hypothetical protein